MSNCIDLTGKKFGRWTVISRAPGNPNNSATYWLCDCQCGRRVAVNSSHLRRGKTLSCGCLRNELLRVDEPVNKHPLYVTWLGIKTRCFNADHPSYLNYGARGITMAPQWKDDFEQFVKDVGEKPSPKHTLDRIDNDCNYEPGNIRWATATEQAANRRPYTPQKRDLTGHRFGQWTVAGENTAFKPYSTSRRSPLRFWVCICSCGHVENAVLYSKLLNGTSTSCGCADKDTDLHLKRTNANYLYRYWKRNESEIQEDFEQFATRIGPRPSRRTVLHRFPDGTFDWKTRKAPKSHERDQNPEFLKYIDPSPPTPQNPFDNPEAPRPLPPRAPSTKIKQFYAWKGISRRLDAIARMEGVELNTLRSYLRSGVTAGSIEGSVLMAKRWAEKNA